MSQPQTLSETLLTSFKEVHPELAQNERDSCGVIVNLLETAQEPILPFAWRWDELATCLAAGVR